MLKKEVTRARRAVRGSIQNLAEITGVASSKKPTKARSPVPIAALPLVLLLFVPTLSYLVAMGLVGFFFQLEYGSELRPHQLWTFWYSLFLFAQFLLCFTLVISLLVKPAKLLRSPLHLSR